MTIERILPIQPQADPSLGASVGKSVQWALSVLGTELYGQAFALS